MSEYPNNIFAAPTASAKPLKEKKQFSFSRAFHRAPQQKVAPRAYPQPTVVVVPSSPPMQPQQIGGPASPYGQMQQQPYHNHHQYRHHNHHHQQRPTVQQQGYNRYHEQGYAQQRGQPSPVYYEQNRQAYQPQQQQRQRVQEFPEEREYEPPRAQGQDRHHRHHHHHHHNQDQEHGRHHDKHRRSDDQLEKGHMRRGKEHVEPIPVRLDKSKKKRKPCTWWPPLFFGTFSFVQAAMLALMIWDGGMSPWAQNPMFGPSSDILLKWGALDGELMRGPTWQVWRILSALMITSGIIHLLINFVIQAAMAFQIERVWAFYRIGPIFLFSGLGGNLLTALFLPHINAIGSTPALTGMMGAMLANQIINFRSLVGPVRGLVLQLIQIAIFIIVGFMPIFDNFANIGGLVCGLLSGLIFVPKIQTKKWKYCGIVIRIMGGVGLALYFLFFGTWFFVFSYFDCAPCRYLHPTWRDIFWLINWLIELTGIKIPGFV